MTVFSQPLAIGKTNRMRLATLNVQTLTGRLPNIIDLMSDLELDILFLQETRVSYASRPTLVAFAKAQGFNLVTSEPSMDANGAIIGGLAILTRWPIQHIATPTSISGQESVQLIKIHRPDDQPLIAVNVHFNPGNAAARGATLNDLLQYLQMTGGD